MSKYTENDFMPPEARTNANVEATTTPDAEARNTPESEEAPSPAEDIHNEAEPGAEVKSAEAEAGEMPVAEAGHDPERGVVSEPAVPSWCRYVSLFFTPTLVTTYAVVLALWITPLSLVSENTRFGVSLVILLITAMIPLAFKITMARLYASADRASFMRRSFPSIVLAVCQAVAAYYLYRIHAPEWLVMILVAAMTVALFFALTNRALNLNATMCAMGALTAIVLYLGRNHLLDVSVTPWGIALVLLSGLAGSAQTGLNGTKMNSLAVSYIVGGVITYAVMCIHFINPIA